MHVDENDFDMFGDFREFCIGDSKRIVGRGHEHAALQIQNRRFLSRSCFQDGQAASRIVRGIIGRPQDPRIFGKVRHDLFLIPDVIAGGEDIDTPIEKFIRNSRCHAKPGRGILAVEDRQIHCVIFLQVFQLVMDNGAAGLSDRVSDKKNFHWEKRKARMRRVAPLI